MQLEVVPISELLDTFLFLTFKWSLRIWGQLCAALFKYTGLDSWSPGLFCDSPINPMRDIRGNILLEGENDVVDFGLKSVLVILVGHFAKKTWVGCRRYGRGGRVCI